MSSINEILRNLLGKRRLSEARLDYANMDHEDLISLAQKGDQKAFNELYNQYSPLIDKHVRRIFVSTGRGDEEDMRQVASLAFWEAVKAYNPDIHKNGFGAYASMIMQRKLTDELRKDSAEKRKADIEAQSTDDPISDDGEGGEMTVGDTLASTDLTPEEMYLGKEGAKKLIRFMKEKFSERERDVVLRHIKGESISTIAEEMGLSYKAVENTLMRIKNKLADYLRASYRESRKMRRESDIKFSDEEKKVLESVILKVQGTRSIRESSILAMRAEYENYTEEQLDSELEAIEASIMGIEDEMYGANQEYHNELVEDLDDLRMKLSAMEEFLTDEQYKKFEELLDKIYHVEDIDIEYEYTDPYEERGLSRSDFF